MYLPYLLTLLLHIRKSDSTYHSYAALGDSYAAGDGAGSSRLLPNLDAGCARFSEAYPIQTANNSSLNITTFRNLACGGATTSSVLRTQLPRVRDSDIVTVQVGGNEVDFFVLLNECVQQWRPFSTCDAELARARGLAESTQLISRFDMLVATAKRTIRPGTKLLVLGYARFFNDQTEQCNHISFSKNHPQNLLNQSLRRKFNDIVILLNDVIRGIVEAHGATFVDIDRVFEGHRFCEEGIIEPAPDTSWFFSDVGRENMDGQQRRDAQHVFPNPFKRFLNFTSAFHPTSEGHAAIASAVVQTLSA